MVWVTGWARGGKAGGLRAVGVLFFKSSSSTAACGYGRLHFLVAACSCCNRGNRRDRTDPQCRAEVAHDTDHDQNFARHRWFSRVCNSHQRYAAKLSKKFLYEVPKGR